MKKKIYSSCENPTWIFECVLLLVGSMWWIERTRLNTQMIERIQRIKMSNRLLESITSSVNHRISYHKIFSLYAFIRKKLQVSFKIDFIKKFISITIEIFQILYLIITQNFCKNVSRIVNFLNMCSSLRGFVAAHKIVHDCVYCSGGAIFHTKSRDFIPNLRELFRIHLKCSFIYNCSWKIFKQFLSLFFIWV